MKNLLNKIFFASLFILGCISSRAQSYTHGVQVPKVEKAGYYMVMLPENVYSVANKKRTNLRVFDDNANEIPSLMMAISNTSQKLAQVPVKFRYMNNAAYFDIILDPKERIDLSEILFTISNAIDADNLTADIFEVQGDWATYGERRPAELESNAWSWEKLRSEVSLSKGSTDTEFKINYSGTGLRKPTRIVIKGISKTNILKNAAYEALRMDESAMHIVDSLQYTITEDAATKSTLIKGSLPYPAFLSTIKLDIDDSQFFRREATLSTTEKVKKGLFGGRDRGVMNQTLNSGSDNIFMFSLRVQEFEIYIHNNDNAPLRINSVRAYAPPAYMVSWLEPGKTYTVKAGEESMHAPKYDLIYNSDIKIADTLIIQSAFMPLQGEASGNTKTILLWLTLGLCILVLGGMAFSMIKKEKVEVE